MVVTILNAKLLYLPRATVIAVAATATLAACASGGGGSSVSGGGSTSTPPPSGFTITPAAPATSGSNSTSAPVASASAPNFGNAPTVGTAFPLIQSVVQVSSNSVGPDTATNNAGATLVVASPINGQNAVELKVPSLGIDTSLTEGTPTPGPNGSTVELAGATGNYFLAGVWSEKLTSTSEISAFISGYQTPASALPTVGIAAYTAGDSVQGYVVTSQGVGTLLGTATLSVNFSNGAITGTLNNITANSVPTNGLSGIWDTLNVNASIASSTSAFSGNTSVSTAPRTMLSLGAGATGSINGRFYGPQADEIGAVWTLSDSSGTAVGVIGAPNKGSGAPMSPVSSIPPSAQIFLNGNPILNAAAGSPPIINAAAPATVGNSPPAPVLASAGGASLDGPQFPAGGTAFALTQSVMQLSNSGLIVDNSANSGGATLVIGGFPSTSNSTNFDLKIPSLGINDNNIQISGTLGAQAVSGGSFGVTDVRLAVEGLNYTSFGEWMGTSASSQTDVAAFTLGYQTPVANLPTSGTATYSGTGNVGGSVYVRGQAGNTATTVAGDASLTANFSNGQVTGTFTNMQSYTLNNSSSSTAYTYPWNDVSVSASIAAGTTKFSGTTMTTSQPASPLALKNGAAGSINGGFYGPNAENLSAVWTLSNGDGSGTAFGVVGAAKQ